ncbi:MAG: hypothetical protein AAFS13_07645 [Pseudomonadota bacterium]
MKTVLLSLTILSLAAAASAEAPLPDRETGHGETVSTFLGLCVDNKPRDVRDILDTVRRSGWTVFYEIGAEPYAASEGETRYEAAASSAPGDTCGLHVTVEAKADQELHCEVIVSQFCQATDTKERISETVVAELADTETLTLDPVSTADENRRLQDHVHQVYRASNGDGPLVRLADTGGTLYLSSITTLRDK